MLINFQISKDWHWIVLPMTGAGVWCLCLAGGSVGHDLGTGDMGTQMVATRSHRPTWQEKLCLKLSLMFKVCNYIK